QFAQHSRCEISAVAAWLRRGVVRDAPGTATQRRGYNTLRIRTRGAFAPPNASTFRRFLTCAQLRPWRRRGTNPRGRLRPWRRRGSGRRVCGGGRRRGRPAGWKTTNKINILLVLSGVGFKIKRGGVRSFPAFIF